MSTQNLNWGSLIADYEQYNPNEKIFLRKLDHAMAKYDFNKASQAIQNQGYLTSRQFEAIANWRTGKDKYTKRYSTSKIQNVTSNVIGLSTPADRIDELTDLSGVSVEVASAVLAIIFPDLYPVIDNRSYRAAIKELTNKTNFLTYSDYVSFLDNYNSGFSKQTYIDYVKILQSVASGISYNVRQINMALWAYDKNNQ